MNVAMLAKVWKIGKLENYGWSQGQCLCWHHLDLLGFCSNQCSKRIVVLFIVSWCLWENNQLECENGGSKIGQKIGRINNQPMCNNKMWICSCHFYKIVKF